MGLIDDILGELSYTEDVDLHPHFAQALQGMLGGEDEPGLGLDGLLQRLREAGLGGVVDSWMATGTSVPISPDQVGEAIGEADTQMMAARAGFAPEAFLATLAEHLPGLVDRLSPNGQFLPAGAGATSTI